MLIKPTATQHCHCVSTKFLPGDSTHSIEFSTGKTQYAAHMQELVENLPNSLQGKGVTTGLTSRSKVCVLATRSHLVILRDNFGWRKTYSDMSKSGKADNSRNYVYGFLQQKGETGFNFAV